MTIIGVMGCSALLVCAFGMYDGANDLKEWEFSHINHYGSKLVIDEDTTASEVDEIADKVNGDKITNASTPRLRPSRASISNFISFAIF